MGPWAASVVKPLFSDDTTMLEDLVLAAVNEASRKVDEQVAEKTQGLAGGMNIPGLT